MHSLLGGIPVANFFGDEGANSVVRLDSHLLVDNALLTAGGVFEVGILFLKNFEILFGFPVPDTVRGEDHVHLLEGPLVGLGV